MKEMAFKTNRGKALVWTGRFSRSGEAIYCTSKAKCYLVRLSDGASIPAQNPASRRNPKAPTAMFADGECVDFSLTLGPVALSALRGVGTALAKENPTP